MLWHINEGVWSKKKLKHNCFHMKQLLAIQLPCLWSTPVKSSTLRMSHQLYPMLFYWCFVWCRELTLMNICIDTSKKKNVWEKKMKWFIASTGNCSVWALMTIRKRGRRFPAVISPLLGDVDVVDGFWFDCLPTPKLTEVWNLIQTSPGLLPLWVFFQHTVYVWRELLE